MKKTLLALTVTSLFSAGAMAAQVIDHGDTFVEKNFKDTLEVKAAANGDEYLFADGKIVGKVKDLGNGAYSIEGTRSAEFKDAIVSLNEDNSVNVRVNDKNGNHHMTNVIEKIDQNRNNDQRSPDVTLERAKAQAKMIKDGLDHVVNANQGLEIDGVKYTNEQVRGMANEFNDLSKQQQMAIASRIDNEIKYGTIEKIEIVDEKSDHGANKVIEDDTHRQENTSEIEKNSRHNAAQDKQIGSNTNRIASNEEKIAGLEESMKTMGNKMLQLEERMDGVVATSHAVTNARPVLSAVGEYGLGFGVGAAGSKQALAFGGAMQMTENWSASTTVNYETKGKHSKGQFSAGVGAQYKF